MLESGALRGRSVLAIWNVRGGYKVLCKSTRPQDTLVVFTVEVRSCLL